MKVKEIKRNDIFILKFTYSLYLATQIYTAPDSSKIKRSFDNLHYAACKQSHSRVRSKRSQYRLRAFRLACSNRSERVFTNARDRALSELTNGYLTPLSARMFPN